MADEVDDRTEFLNSMLRRGPNKRKIKPAENNELLALALGDIDEESEDDEDFEVHSEDEEGSFSESEDESSKLQTIGDPSQPMYECDDSGDSSVESSPGKPMTVEELLKSTKTLPKSNAQDQLMLDTKKLKADDSLRLLICGICLGDNSDEDDEIVECDNCGISVHESCYGISTDNDNDTDSDKTSDTDSSTEPWFCDACKSGLVPECELCPNLGGIFKETLRGQWVHLICALYTPGVTFDVPEKLEGVVLIDMHSSRWGAKECNLCEDVNLSRTGVCIGCDAGLCKTFFHATWFLEARHESKINKLLNGNDGSAQRKGLLSELPEEDDEDVADPLYAHCKLHLDKNIAKKKRQTYLTYISYVKQFEEVDVDDERKSRVETSLKFARETYFQQKAERSPPPAPKQKVARSILSCPSVFRHLLKKAELLGFITQQSKISNSFGNVRRKWHIPASLTVEFVNYFYDRSSRMENMKKRLEDLSTNNKDLQEEEKLLRQKYQELSETTKVVTSRCETVKGKCFHLHNLLCRLAEEDFALPEYLETIKCKAKKETVQSEELKLSVCSTCEKTENQHLMVDCDTCHSFYHLACVDPPLSRMPKKSKKMLWQCTECDSSSSEDGEMKVDPNDNTSLLASRQKRSIKEPSKFIPGKDPNLTRKRKRKQSSLKPVKVKSEKPKVPRKQRTVLTKKQKPIDVRSNCSTCGQLGDNSNLVRCDECKFCFHFWCLDPPAKNNPKPKGYSWYCTDCDETPDEESDEEEVEEEKLDTSVNDENNTVVKENSVTENITV